MTTHDPNDRHATPPEPEGEGPNLKFAVITGTVVISLILLATLWLRQHPEFAAQRSVVASIPPLHSLVSGVMAGIDTPQLLLAGGTSPHSQTLRPSESETFYRAGLIFWVDPGVESALPRMIDLLPSNVYLVQVGRLQELTRLPLRRGGLWIDDHADDHGEEDATAHADNDQGDGSDPHVWLDPQNAIVWVNAIANSLAVYDPDRAARYRQNAAALVTRLRALDAELRERLAPVADVPYLVYHDAYRYLEARYGLSPAGAFTVAADRPVSAQRYASLRALARDGGVRCLFVEPQFPPQQAERLAAETGIRIAPLDPLGSDLPAGPELYFTLLRQLGDSLSGCLAAR